MKKLIVGFLGVMLLVFGMSGAGAITYYFDFSPSDPIVKGDSEVINGAIFKAAEDYMQTTVSSGSGVIDPFLTIQKNGSEEGFNTDHLPLVLDTTRPAYNYSIQVGDLYPVNFGGVGYYEFLLDIGEPGSDPAQYLTMHDLEFYLADSGGLSTYASLGTSGTLIWDLDAGTGGDSAVQLDSNLWSGSGQNLDLFVYIPKERFDEEGAVLSNYVYLYSAFGDLDPDAYDYPSDGSYEEWCMRPGGVSIPEPTTMLLLGTGLIGLAGLGRKRFKRKEKLHT